MADIIKMLYSRHHEQTAQYHFLDNTKYNDQFTIDATVRAHTWLPLKQVTLVTGTDMRLLSVAPTNTRLFYATENYRSSTIPLLSNPQKYLNKTNEITFSRKGQNSGSQVQMVQNCSHRMLVAQ